MSLNPQILRSYPKAQIRQGADRVSAPDPPAGPPIDGSGLATSAQEERGASWPTGQRQHLSPGSVRRIAISLWQRCAPTRHTSRESRERKSGKWLVRQQPERKEKHRNGQRRANHEQRHELSKLSATHEMQRQRRQTNQTEGETASKTLAFSFARCNQSRSLPAVGPGQGG